LSNTELALLLILMMVINVLGNEPYILLQGYEGSASLKTSHPRMLPL
jgi:hypothetical protein